MTLLTMLFHFDVAGLDVEAGLLGARYDVERAGTQYFIQFPNGANDFEIGRYRSQQPLPTLIKGWSGTQEDPRRYVILGVLQVGLVREVDLPKKFDPGDQLVLLPLLDLLRDSAEEARRLLKEYLDLVATQEGQYWLGTQSDMPRLTWMTRVYDETGAVVPISHHDPVGSVAIHVNAPRLTAESNAKLLAALGEGTRPAIADNFLRDARCLSDFGRDAAQVVLYAAIACEVKVKSSLTALATAEQAELVNLVLENPRDVSIAAAALFDKGCAAVTRRSLRLEDKDLYKAVEKLFQDRNKVAHRGSPDVTIESARAHIVTAVRAFKWLDSLTANE